MSLPERTGWEYRTVQHVDAEEMEELGREGWELASVFGSSDVPQLIFRRPRLSFREQVTLEQKRRYYALWGVAANDGDGGAKR
jgi:hypothetical protein